MLNCLFCNKRIPTTRLKKWTKYCSNLCNKRAWYVRHNPNAKSYFVKNPEFWKTTTGIGFKWEKYAAKMLGAKHLMFGKGADLDWKGRAVDVKVCNLYKRKSKRGKLVKKEQAGWWVFNRNKRKPIDYFYCICLKDGEPVKRLLIPNAVFPNKSLVIGANSRYNIYQV